MGDSREREVEICREFMRDRCSRSDFDCKYAHPPPYVDIKDGYVMVCMDFKRGRCNRNNPPCRYFHAPEKFESRGGDGYRSRDYGGGRYMGGGGGPSRGGPSSYGSGGMYPPYFPNSMGGPMRSSSWGYGGGPPQKMRSDLIEVCREFKRGKCEREECRYAHPAENIRVGSDNMITYCMDFVNGHCDRDSCRYFHPPPHLLSRLGGGRTGPSSSGSRKRSHSSSDAGGKQPSDVSEYATMPAAADQDVNGSGGNGYGMGHDDDYGSAAKRPAVDYGYD